MKILITAGPTQEPIDPVRFISNYSTGSIGYTLAQCALTKGHQVTLITGPTKLKAPLKAKIIKIKTASEMNKAVKKNIQKADCLIMTAAVADYRPKRKLLKKIKKSNKKLILELVKNPDILKTASKYKENKIFVGFALETHCLISRAKEKLKSKKLDFIIANKIKKGQNPFGKGQIEAFIIDKKQKIDKIGIITKNKLAAVILDRIEQI